MTTFDPICNAFLNANKNAAPRMRSSLHGIAVRLLPILKAYSPVDSGEYSFNWKLEKTRANRVAFGGQDLLASVSIVNRTDHAYFMEYGAQIGASPWYFKGKKNNTSESGKLKIARDASGQLLVWAGGISPGHKKTIGGAISIAVTDNDRELGRITNVVADQYVKTLI